MNKAVTGILTSEISSVVQNEAFYVNQGSIFWTQYSAMAHHLMAFKIKK
jgi:hypothetical protein